jgi:hypothetical protein
MAPAILSIGGSFEINPVIIICVGGIWVTWHSEDSPTVYSQLGKPIVNIMEWVLVEWI